MKTGIEYVNLATTKNTFGRPELASAYRATDRIIATDGRRMHWITAAEIQEDCDYLDPQHTGAHFPDYQTALLPDGGDECCLTLSKTDRRILKAIKAALKAVDAANMCVHVKVEKDSMTLSACAEGLDLSYEISGVESGKDWEPFGINLGFLLDALECSHLVTIRTNADDPLTAIEVSYSGHYALIMPLTL